MNESKVLVAHSKEELELVERKLRAVNPALFCKEFLTAKFSKQSNWKLLKRVWKRSKGNAIAMILVMPIVRLQTRKPEIALQKYAKIFAESNKTLNKALPKAETKNEKMFIKTSIQLNTIGIQMNTLLLEEIEKKNEAKKLKEKLLAEATTENIFSLWKNAKEHFELGTKIAKIRNHKADIQDKIVEYERQMTKLDKRDIEDFWRAILTDLAVSYHEQKTLIVATPIEILMKSNRLVNGIKKSFWLSELLREKAKEGQESLTELIKWFVTYEDKAPNEMS